MFETFQKLIENWQIIAGIVTGGVILFGFGGLFIATKIESGNIARIVNDAKETDYLNK